MDKIICIGKNYLEHAKELGDKVPEKPVIFLKPPSILKQAKNWDESIIAKLPENAGEVHYETEIVLRAAKDAYQLTADQTADVIDAVTLGLDMTLRTRQMQLKKEGHPWTTAKVFPDAAIIGPWIAVKDFPDYLNTEFSLHIDRQLKQKGFGTQMLVKPNELLVYISQFFPICKGDLIFTGTPAGVGPVTVGSVATLHWDHHVYHVQWK
jgi:2-keto-4-pentenoate hydratase/2-oxohepta-3-ene-1,7-dioic acid hydratase in catechol pathway